MDIQSITPSTCIVRNTAGGKGRTTAIAPGTNTASRHLHYGRIILDPDAAAMRVETGDRETGFVCLGGAAALTVEGAAYALGRYDALYVPRDAAVTIAPGAEGCDLAEIAAPVAKKHPVQHVLFANVQKDPGLHFNAGGEASKRDLNVLFGKNVEAGRIMAGVTFSAQGNWTSWPPHEHAAMLEEAYLYIDMPAPSFGVQLVYTNSREPELATIVREGDVVMMPQGYHPNVAAHERGAHGFGVSPDLGATSEWPKRLDEWMTAHGWSGPGGLSASNRWARGIEGRGRQTSATATT